MNNNSISIIVYILVSDTTNRLLYTLDWIFKEQLKMSYVLLLDRQQWQRQKGIKINYTETFDEDAINIKPAAILFEKDIHLQQLQIGRWKHSTILYYNNPRGVIPFDIFAATFFLISRYEEYFPSSKDKHNRYKVQSSTAYQFRFLQQPVIDQWLLAFKTILIEKYKIHFSQKLFQYQATYDIDMAWAYQQKGTKRTMANFIQDIVTLKWKRVIERAKVLKGKLNDPFDSFERLYTLHKAYNLQAIYFILLGKYSAYDKNTDPNNAVFQKLIKNISRQYQVGIHPSYGSHKNCEIVQNEIAFLQNITSKEITKSRQHFIKFRLPETYRHLQSVGITDDYSMGYATHNGFRAGTSNSFLWFDILKNEVAPLRIHPFAFMDATNIFYQKHSLHDMFLEWERLVAAVKDTQGTFISIWHNYTLGTHKQFKGVWDLYEKMTKYIESVLVK